MRGITVLSANSNSKLQVHCEVTQLQGARSGGVTCARRVAIFVPFWVYDATGLGLQLSPDYSTLVARPRRSNDTQNDMKSGLVPAQPELADWDLWAPAADNPSDRRVARSIPDEGTQSAWMFSCADPTGEDKPAPKVCLRAFDNRNGSQHPHTSTPLPTPYPNSDPIF